MYIQILYILVLAMRIFYLFLYIFFSISSSMSMHQEEKVFSLKEKIELHLLECKNFIEAQNKNTLSLEKQPFLHLCERVTKTFTDWLQQKFNVFTQKNKPPTRISLFSMGSLSTHLCTPYSDIEFGVLIQNYAEGALEYVEKLVQFMHDEREKEDLPAKTMHFDEAGLTPLYKNKEGNIVGTPLLITTPEVMAQLPWILTYRFQGHEKTYEEKVRHYLNTFIKDEKIRNAWKNFYFPEREKYEHLVWVNNLQNIARGTKNIRTIGGVFDLAQEFVHEERLLFLNQCIVSYEYSSKPMEHRMLGNIVYEDIDYHFSKFIGANSFLQDQCRNAPSLNIKKHLFRPVEQFLLNFGFFSNLWPLNDGLKISDVINFYIKRQEKFDFEQTDNLRERLKAGVKRKNLQKALCEYMEIVMGLRLREQWLLDGETHDIVLNVQQMEQDKKISDNTLNILKENAELNQWKIQIEDQKLKKIESAIHSKKIEKTLKNFDISAMDFVEKKQTYDLLPDVIFERIKELLKTIGALLKPSMGKSDTLYFDFDSEN